MVSILKPVNTVYMSIRFVVATFLDFWLLGSVRKLFLEALRSARDLDSKGVKQEVEVVDYSCIFVYAWIAIFFKIT